MRLVLLLFLALNSLSVLSDDDLQIALAESELAPLSKEFYSDDPSLMTPMMACIDGRPSAPNFCYFLRILTVILHTHLCGSDELCFKDQSIAKERFDLFSQGFGDSDSTSYLKRKSYTACAPFYEVSVESVTARLQGDRKRIIDEVIRIIEKRVGPFSMHNNVELMECIKEKYQSYLD